ncbi:hypothetical protein RR46_12487 [Papilio xuthus]|uniref:Uncharacterized protein n=1 Tax=Papilio xuthus TaxID=66420 RepID=A0A194PT17_PAPXU|nr:hypothetical protein RR46_12487 [Papilio xuthus]
MQGDIKNRMSTVTLQLSKLNFTQVAVPNTIDKYRWRDAVELDLWELQAMDCQEKTQDTRLRRSLVLEANNHFGSLRQRSKQGDFSYDGTVWDVSLKKTIDLIRGRVYTQWVVKHQLRDVSMVLRPITTSIIELTSN